MYDNIHKSLFDIVSFFNRPKQDKALLGRAGISLDTALFPLLMRIGMQGPIGIVALAEQVNRDHSTVSRQADKLIQNGLVAIHPQTQDRRLRHLIVTQKGLEILDRITETRRIMMGEALKNWSAKDMANLDATLHDLAVSLKAYAQTD